jgi:anti-anti-sigma factor
VADPAPASLLTLDIERAGDVALVRCHGRLISGGTDILYSQISPLIPVTKRIVLDLTDLVHMDSMGLGTLIRLYVSAKSAGCELKLINLGTRIRKLLAITNLISVFAIVGEQDTRII